MLIPSVRVVLGKQEASVRFILLLAGLFLLGGCTRGYKTVIGGDTYAAVPMDKTATLLAFPEEGSYKVIGIVTAKGAPLASDTSVYRKLQKGAADLGADAVVVGEAARVYRGTIPGEAYTHGNVNLNSGNYSATTSYSPPTPMYGLDVRGIAIKYQKGGSQ